MKAAATSIQIQRAAALDAGSIASILRQAFVEFESSYTKKGFAATVLGTRAILRRMREGPVWVAICEGRFVATASAVQKETGVYVRGMAVIPLARGLGIGRLLLQEAECFAFSVEARRLFLSTTPFLARAIELYGRSGFHRTNEGPHDLFGTPLFTMEKRLAHVAADDPEASNAVPLPKSITDANSISLASGTAGDVARRRR